MKLCIIGPKESKESLILKTLAEERGHECKRVNMMDIYFEITENTFSARHRRFELMEFDVFLFRSVRKYFKEAMLLAEYLDNSGKIVIDKSLATDRFFSIIDRYHLAQKGIQQLDLVLTNSLKSARDVLMDIDHPIIIKPSGDGIKQKAVVSEDWTDSYDFARTNKDKAFLFLKHLNLNSYHRLYVVGSEVIGGTKRTIVDQELKLQYSSEFKTTALKEINDDERELALKAALALHFEIAAIDIVEHEGLLYVLETKRSPKFLKFQSVSKVNYPEKLLQYVESKIA